MTFTTMKRLARVASAVMLAAFSTGCAIQFGRADHDAAVRSPSDAYVVIGVQPETTAISVFQGWVNDKGFRQNPLPPASFVGFPEDGFVVTRVSPGTAYAITYVTMYPSKDALLTQPLVPCSRVKTLVFTVPAGQTVYMASVRYRQIGRGAVAEFGRDFDAAKAYVESHYPNLAPGLSEGQPQFLPVTGNQCIGEY